MHTSNARHCQAALRSYPDILDVAQACQLLGVSAKTVYKLIQSGVLPALKIGRAHKIPKAAIQQLFSARKEHAPLPKK